MVLNELKACQPTETKVEKNVATKLVWNWFRGFKRIPYQMQQRNRFGTGFLATNKFPKFNLTFFLIQQFEKNSSYA